MAPRSLFAQSAPSYLTQGGAPDFSVTQKVQNGFINLANGNLHLEFPFVSLSERGRPYTVKMVYDSRQWQYNQMTCQGCTSSWTFQGIFNNPPLGGWRLVTSADTGYVYPNVTTNECSSQNTGFVWVAPEGEIHSFPSIFTEMQGQNGLYVGPCQQPIPNSAGYDAAGYYMSVTNYTNATVIAPDGTQVYPQIKDTNGNYYSYDNYPQLNTGDPAGNVTVDTVGRSKPVLITKNCNGNVNLTCYDILTSNGTRARYTVTWGKISVCTNFGFDDFCPGASGSNIPAGPSMPVILSIGLPDNTNYSFSYDAGATPGHYGLLTSMTLPTGGQASFTHALFVDANANTNVDPASPNLWATSYTLGGSTWSFSPQVTTRCNWAVSAYCQQQITVTKPTGDQTVYGFTLWWYEASWNSSVRAYSGAVGGPLLMAVDQYVPFNQCLSSQDAPATTTTTTYGPNGPLVKKMVYHFDEVYQGDQFHPHVSCPNGYVIQSERVRKKEEYGYGNGSPGALARSTSYSYMNDSSGSYGAMPDLVSKVTVFDGSGTQIGQAVYEYDNYTTPLASAGAVQRDASYNSTWPRGNLTATSTWRNTDGGWLTTRNQYDDAGNVVSTADANGNVTSYSYADSWADQTCRPSGGNAAAYRTTVTDALGNSSSTKFNSCSGSKATAKDANGQTAAFVYDAMDRPQQALAPLSSGSWRDYISATQVDEYGSVTQSPASGCSGCAHTQIALDALGRTQFKTVANDPDGAVTVKTSYDALGRVSRTSNPYRGSDTAGESYAYDAMNRVVATTRADGSVARAYYGSDVSANGGIPNPSGGLSYPVLSVDEAGNKIQRWTDAFGRLVEVDEFPSGNYVAPVPAMSGSGSVTVNGSDGQYTWDTCPGTDYSPCWETDWDAGTISITVNGVTASADYGQFAAPNGYNNSPSDMANLLANAINNNPSMSVTASLNGSTLTLTAKTAGASTNYLISTVSGDYYFTAPGMDAGGNFYLTGGQDAKGSGVYVTLYNYDALGNLVRVDQRGSAPSDSTQWRTRTFTYNSLGQLLTANNPETGQISYTYDANGNVASKTDARGITISYSYDALNRLTRKTYSNGEPSVSYAYDQGANGIGHRTGMTDSSGSTSWTYDALGRVASESRTIRGVTKIIGYAYNPGGVVTSIYYPSGNLVNYGVTAIGRLISANDSTANYVFSANYTADGKLARFQSGQSGGITNTFLYNPRLQICREVASTTGVIPSSCTDSSRGNVLDFQYDFHYGAGDNGNLYAAINNRDTTRTQNYTYDPLNRLASATTAGTDCSVKLSSAQTKYWGESFSYDAWGNLTGKTATLCNAENMTLTADANNRLIGFGPYDAAGDMTGNGATYNAEGELIYENSGYHYVYDGDGQRVAKVNGASGTLYFGGGLAETDLAGNIVSEYILFNGARIARKDGAVAPYPVHYYFANQVHSTALITDASGKIEDEDDYYPWGGLLQYSNSTPNHFWFGGKERDQSGADYFGARYYANVLGRFVTADWSAKVQGVPYADYNDPQSLNLYAYVRNNPIARIDPDGHCDPGSGPSDDAEHCAWARIAAARENANKNDVGGEWLVGNRTDAYLTYRSGAHNSGRDYGAVQTPPDTQGVVEMVAETKTTKNGIETDIVTYYFALYSTKPGEEGRFLGFYEQQTVSVSDLNHPLFGNNYSVTAGPTRIGGQAEAARIMGAQALNWAADEAALANAPGAIRQAIHHPLESLERAGAGAALAACLFAPGCKEGVLGVIGAVGGTAGAAGAAGAEIKRWIEGDPQDVYY